MTDLREIDRRVASLHHDAGPQLVFKLLEAYGLPKASITRLKNGSYNRATENNEVLWKGKVFCRYADEPGDDLHLLIDQAGEEERILKERPRFLIVHNDEALVAIDRVTEDTLDIPLASLGDNASFFYPWAGVEKSRRDNVSEVDIKATEKMAKLYDEIVKLNEISSAQDRHNLNVFFARLLFCFFAEDSEVFEAGQFTNAIGSLTQADGSDTHLLLDEIFATLNQPEDEREKVRPELRGLGYVGGSLFEQDAPSPGIGRKARSLLIDSGTIDWAQINPDIFGSMVQVVVDPEQRAGLGMHYTSPDNILKVLRPLFLDELETEFLEAEDDERKLKRLLERISKIKVLDPACGSGNFLIIAYKRLRELENQIIERLGELNPGNVGLFKLSGVSLDNFFGIEISDFASQIAKLSLWLAKHQANLEFREHFGVEISLIPIEEEGHIVCDNALRLDWAALLRPGDEEVMVCGNPPYLGSTLQTKEQKEDLSCAFGERRYPKRIDYVSAWFIKGAEYLKLGKVRVAFVATSSICQGSQVGDLWPIVFNEGVEIAFAHSPFVWTNSARGNAGVTCTIIGIREVSQQDTFLFTEGQRIAARSINAYLVPGGRSTVVRARREPVANLPQIAFGNRLVDGGNLILSPSEKEDLLRAYPRAKELVRPLLGAEEILNGRIRWCLFISDEQLPTAMAIDPIAERLSKVVSKRSSSPEAKTRDLAKHPNRLYSPSHQEKPSIAIPGHTSERRDYVPMLTVNPGTVVTNAASVIYTEQLWPFALIQSRIHMAWMRVVAGRLESRYRYSGTLVYNTFPVPELSDDLKAGLETMALGVLSAREDFPEQTLAELYDPDKMPDSLREAHLALDDAVDALYSDSGFVSDEGRLSALFDLYEDMTADEGELTLA